MTNETITCNLIKKGMLSKVPKTDNRRLLPIIEHVFKQLKDYFRVKMIALLLCEINKNENELTEVNRILSTIISDLLMIDQQTKELTRSLQLFVSTIILKQSWNFLLNLLKSESIQRINNQWATILYSILELKQKQSLQLCHQIQFASSLNTSLSIFPRLHQLYQELRDIIDICIQSNTWKTLSDWMTRKLTADTNRLKSNEIIAILLLNIYYDYYCTNQLDSILSLLGVIQNTLQLSTEEFQIFQAFIQPKQYMSGYFPKSENFLNHIFQLDTKDEFDLTIRHLLVNLLAMILLGGKQSFLWTFVFQPSALQHTFGFGSTSQSPIQSSGVHYDCGCILSENGDLVRFTNTGHISTLKDPAIYVAYFSTFGALAWHLLLNQGAIEHLHGPILSPSAINDTRTVHQLVGDNIRAKVCHFVCTRILSSFHFLSNLTNQTDCCLLLNRCFEQMAYLTQEQNGWIKTSYKALSDQHRAEQEYQNQVFYFIHGKLMEYKTCINELNLKSDIQRNLQNFVDQTPIIVQFTHFKTALHHPMYSQTSLKILCHILNSFDFLKITNLIYHLSQFYLLLHQTYTQLIERKEFVTITLRELYNRGQKYYQQQQYQNEERAHQSIINNGIEAVNMYHRFANGLIQPGACDETQRFIEITHDTPVNYLVTTENHDEGDIIMRILNVLVDYHNSLLELIEKEFNNDENTNLGVLKNLVNNLTSRNVSILKVARDNTGAIALNKQDCIWIEQLCQASLINTDESYFLTNNSTFVFDFTYVQSQILRTYFLLCRINHRHIHQKYQCHTKRIETKLTTEMDNFELNKEYLILLSNEQRENKWNHLKDISFDKLSHTFNFLRQIALTLQNSEGDKSSLYLFQFIKEIDHQNEFDHRLEQCEIQNFQLCYMNDILKLYADSLNECQHSSTDVPPLLRVPIHTQLNNEFNVNLDKNILHFDYKNDIAKIHTMIQYITEFLNELKSIEDTLLQQCSQSLVQICQHLRIDNVLISWIPEGIRCENYLAVSIYLIRVRSILQERKLNMEEKQMKIWNENVSSNEQNDKHENRYYQYLQTEDEESNTEESHSWILPSIELSVSDHENLTQYEEPKQYINHSIEYKSLMELEMKLIPLMSSRLIQQVHQYRTEFMIEQLTISGAQKFVIRHRDDNLTSFQCKSEKFYEKLKKFFVDKKYDSTQFVFIDKADLAIDLTKNDNNILYKTFLECHVVEKQSIVTVRFHFRNSKYEYLTTSSNNISTVIYRFIADNQLNSLSLDISLCFSNEYGMCIDDERVSDLCAINSKTVDITVTEETSDTSNLCELNLRYKKDQNKTNLFHSTSTWGQINMWLNTLSETDNSTVTNYAFSLKEPKTILYSDQIISTTINHTQSVTIDVINQNSLVEVVFSTQVNTYSAYALKSIKISLMLQDQELLKQLNLTEISLNDLLLILEEKPNQQILTQNDFERPLSDYCTTETQSIHFRVATLILVTKYDDNEQIRISLPDGNITVEQLLKLTGTSFEIYKFLAPIDTKRIVEYNQTLSTMHSNQFILCKENETCRVQIIKAEDSDATVDAYQRYILSATIADIYKENQLDSLRQYLLYQNEYVPSIETQLACFRLELPIRFTVINDNLPIRVLVTNNGTEQNVKLYCFPSMTAKRLCTISCQLFGLNAEHCELMTQDDQTQVDDDITLEDISETESEIKFRLISAMLMSCSVTYSEKTITMFYQQTTLAATIVTDTLEKLHILYDDINEYVLLAMTDDSVDIDLDLSIEDIRELFPPTSNTMSFKLMKNNE